MMNSVNDDDEFGANPFRSDGGAQPDMFAPVPIQQPMQQQQPQMQMPPPLPQQSYPPQNQPQQFAQVPPPMMTQPQQQQQQHPYHPQAAPVNPNMPAGLMAPAAGMPQQQGQMPPPAQQAQPMSIWGSCMTCLTFDSYKAYFDIDADDIVNRIRGVFLHFYKPEHFRNNIMGPYKTNELKGPDLYGPFWITMTLIFFIGVTANIHGYVHRNDVEEFDYDINHLLHAASVLISFAFCLPIILWMTTTCCMSMNALTLAEWLCLYGYSLVPFMPAVVLSIIPVSLVAWVTLGMATGASCLMVIRNVAPSLMASGGQSAGQAAKGPPIILVILGTHMIFLIVLKFTFYHFSPHHTKAAPTFAPTVAGTAPPM